LPHRFADRAIVGVESDEQDAQVFVDHRSIKVIGGSATKQLDMSLPNVNPCVTYVVDVALLVVTIGAIVVGATQLTNACEVRQLTVSVAEWTLVWGAVATAAVFVSIAETALDRRNACLNFVKWLLVLFLVVPWLVIGTIVLMQPRQDCAGILVFWSVVPLVVTYVYANVLLYVLKFRTDATLEREDEADKAAVAREIVTGSEAAANYSRVDKALSFGSRRRR